MDYSQSLMLEINNRLFIALLIGTIFMTGSCNLEDESISYSKDIKPILNKKCLRCHGGIKKQGGFSLLFEEEAFANTESGKPAIIPGNAKKSELVKRISSDDTDLRMPQEGTPCTDEEISLISQWIDQGAKWDQHWAYRPTEIISDFPDSPEARSPIDYYIQARLKQIGLKPNPSADPAHLARRVSLDILGLPPDADIAKAYLADPSEDNYRQMVDQLLASPHYGEKMAAWWMDLARYADSKGYEKDPHRSIWRYRDWLINAFNDDMPFDQFTIEQLAGDLLPNPSTSQLIATAFHRNTMTNTEGGTEDEEFRTTAVIDRVNTTFEVWQGTTMGCVQCHSHPFDPIKHEEYYRVFALFNSSQDADLDNEFPYLIEPRDSLQNQRIQEIASWINQESNQEELPKTFDARKIRDMVLPRLFGDLADDFQSVLIQSNGSFSNSAYNANNQKNKKYYLVFSDIDLTDLEQISYKYKSNGSDVRIDLRIDSINGPIIAQSQLEETTTRGRDFQWAHYPVSQASGRHHLILHMVNTTGDFYTGVAHLSEIRLNYANRDLDSEMIALQDSLLSQYRDGIKTPIMRDRTALLPRENYVFERGNYLVKGPPVKPGVPEILNPSETEILDRMDLARWLIDTDNTLTARVMVNRIWEQIFGNGLVETLEDFGTQGEPPTHPRLLNYLAHHFANEWEYSFKRLIKEIVTSTTYRQSVQIDSLRLELDPFNRYYSRGSRFRLSAEQIRDQALFVSGLLSREMGGKSVMPPQPDNVWQVVYSNAKWVEAKGDDRYRRALYTYWKRTTPYPSMIAFDSPSREFCVSRRIRTNTPLQALVTLNDTVFLEAATELSAWMKEEGNGDIHKSISMGYQKAFLHPPNDQTVQILGELYHQTRDEANEFTVVEERVERMDPMTIVASAILNLDAFLTKS